MSYSVITRPVAKDQLLGALDKALAEAGLSDPEPHVSDHVATLLAPFPELALGVGRPEDHVQVQITGHANPGHEPVTGWADESITVTVRAVPADDVTDPAAEAREQFYDGLVIPAHPTTGLVGAPGEQITKVVTLPEPDDTPGFATAE